MEKEPIVRLTIRCPKSLHDALKAKSEESETHQNVLAIQFIRDGLKLPRPKPIAKTAQERLDERKIPEMIRLRNAEDRRTILEVAARMDTLRNSIGDLSNKLKVVATE